MLDKNELLDGVDDQVLEFALIGVAIFILYIIGVSIINSVAKQVSLVVFIFILDNFIWFSW